MDQLVAHLIGDYLLQSHWMATNKTARSTAALIHVTLYAIPFLFLTRSIPALAVIVGTHYVVDRYRLARHVCWVKNFLAPRGTNPPFAECPTTGFPPETPVWMSVWLMILVDQTIHLTINYAALSHLA